MQYKKLLAMVVAALAISALLLPLTVSAAGWSASSSSSQSGRLETR